MHGLTDPREKMLPSWIEDPEENEGDRQESAQSLSEPLQGASPPSGRDVQNSDEEHRPSPHPKPEDEINQVGLPSPLGLGSGSPTDEREHSDEHEGRKDKRPPPPSDPFDFVCRTVHPPYPVPVEDVKYVEWMSTLSLV